VVLRPMVRSGARCASQVLDHVAQAVARGAARCESQVLYRGAQTDARGATHVLVVVPRPLPAVPLVVRRMCMAVVPGPMPAAVASRCCRRIFQQLAFACGS
jgi:hypothetical protein